MHGSNFDHMSCLLGLQYTVAASAGHASDVQQLRPIDHVVVLSSRDADALGFHLEAQRALIFPQCRCDTRFDTGRSDLPGCVERAGRRVVAGQCVRSGRGGCIGEDGRRVRRGIYRWPTAITGVCVCGEGGAGKPRGCC